MQVKIHPPRKIFWEFTAKTGPYIKGSYLLVMNAYLDLPPLEVLNDRFEYDPETGALTRIRWGYGPAGYLTSTGYLRVKVNDTHYRVARLVWKMHYGEDPPKNMSIDHINRDRTDNRIANLRLATHRENNCNRKGRGDRKQPQTVAKRTVKTNKPVILTSPSGEEAQYPSVQSAADYLGVYATSVSNALQKRAKTIKGYTARYA
jgi:hypothetical protein